MSILEVVVDSGGTSELLLHVAVAAAAHVVSYAIGLASALLLGHLLNAEGEAGLLRVARAHADHLVEQEAIWELNSQLEVFSHSAVAVRLRVLVVEEATDVNKKIAILCFGS